MEFPDVYDEMILVALERDKRIREAKKKALSEYRKWRALKEKEEEGKEQEEGPNQEILVEEDSLFEFIHKNKEIVNVEQNIDK